MALEPWERFLFFWNLASLARGWIGLSTISWLCGQKLQKSHSDDPKTISFMPNLNYLWWTIWVVRGVAHGRGPHHVVKVGLPIQLVLNWEISIWCKWVRNFIEKSYIVEKFHTICLINEIKTLKRKIFSHEWWKKKKTTVHFNSFDYSQNSVVILTWSWNDRWKCQILELPYIHGVTCICYKHLIFRPTL